MSIMLSASDILNTNLASDISKTKTIQYLHEVLDTETMFYIQENALKKHAFHFLSKNLLMTEEIIYINKDRDKFITSILSSNLDSDGSIIKNAMLTQQDLDDISNFFDGLDKALTPRVANKINTVKESLEGYAHYKFVQHIKDKYTLAESSTEDNVTNSDFEVVSTEFGFSVTVSAPFEYNFRCINLFHKKLFERTFENVVSALHSQRMPKTGLSVDKYTFSNPAVYDALVMIRENVVDWLEHAKKMSETVKDRSADFAVADPFQSLFNSL